MEDDDAPPIREFKDRGTVWLLGSRKMFAGLASRAVPGLSDRLDFDRAVRLNRSFVPDDLRKRETDIAYRVPFRDGDGGVLIDILTDHQSEADPAMSWRVLHQMDLLWEQTLREYEDRNVPRSEWQLNPVVPIVFYTGDRSWRGPRGIQEMMLVPAGVEEFVPNHRTAFLSLHEVPEEVLRHQGDTLGRLLWAFRKVGASLEEFSTAVDETGAHLESLPDEEQGEWLRAMHFLLLLIRHNRTLPERNVLVERVFDGAIRHRERVEGIVKTDAEELIEMGERKGEQRGRQEGRQEGRQDAILDALLVRFGQAPEPLRAAVQSVKEGTKLSELFRSAVTCRSLDDFQSALSR